MQRSVMVIMVSSMIGGLLSNNQTVNAQSTDSWDVKVLHTVYESPSRGFQKYMQISDQTAYPVFYAGPVVAWGSTFLLDSSGKASYRLTLAHVGAVASTIVLKRLIRRPRPYAIWPRIAARRSSDIAGVNVKDPYAFPSGHTALSFAIVTSLSMTYPKWYVMAPGYAWAISIGLSRTWMGLHYPSDVIGGAVLGTVIGATVHLVRRGVTPNW